MIRRASGFVQISITLMEGFLLILVRSSAST
jgi:hypothetical protein